MSSMPPITGAPESHMRSLVKGISWRAVGTLDTMIISYIITGNIRYAAFIGSTEAMTKVFLFWAHERVWQKIRWGRVIPSVSSP